MKSYQINSRILSWVNAFAVLVLIADDMGFGDPGCNNPQSKIPMPHLDNLAADGLRFIDTHTPASVTTKSET